MTATAPSRLAVATGVSSGTGKESARSCRQDCERPSGSDGFRTSVEGDWACVWVKASGELTEVTGALLVAAIDAALERHPRKVRLLLDGVRGAEARYHELLTGAAASARAKGTKLRVQGRARGSGERERWPARLIRLRQGPASLNLSAANISAAQGPA
jgi:hypothetical protein